MRPTHLQKRSLVYSYLKNRKSVSGLTSSFLGVKSETDSVLTTFHHFLGNQAESKLHHLVETWKQNEWSKRRVKKNYKFIFSEPNVLPE